MVCEICFFPLKRREQKRFCSLKCKGISSSRNIGENAPHWSGGNNKCLGCTKLLGDRSAIRCKSCETKRRILEGVLVCYKKGHASFKGRKHSLASRQLISANRKGKMVGSNHPAWIKDRNALKRTGDSQRDRRSSAYNTWRREVWLRDNFTCKIANPNCSGRIEAHHILGYEEYSELRYQLNNGITLCHAHHPRRRAEEKRLSPYFQELVSASKVLS